MLAVKERARCDVAAEREPELERPLDRRLVRRRQCARKGEADWARLRVRRSRKGVRAAAEHLRLRLELDMNLETDDGLPLMARHRGTPSPSTAAPRCRRAPRTPRGT